MNNKQYPTRMHEVLGAETGEVFAVAWVDKIIEYALNCRGEPVLVSERDSDGYCPTASGFDVAYMINHPDRIIRKPRPGCWHCWNIEAHKIEYVTAVKDKDGRPMNTPVDIPYRYCPSCGRKLEVEE